MGTIVLHLSQMEGWTKLTKKMRTMTEMRMALLFWAEHNRQILRIPFLLQILNSNRSIELVQLW
jgi:hypothetical protein